MKKLILIILATVVIFTCSSCQKEQEPNYPDAFLEGITIENIIYKFSLESKTFYVSGPANSDIKIARIQKEIENFPVTHISYYAFKNCVQLKAVILPEGITSILDEAFFGCTSLEYIEIPTTVKNIGSLAFWQCYSLRELKLPSSITKIKECTFSHIRYIHIPESVKIIENNAFGGAENALPTIYYESTRSEWSNIKMGSQYDSTWPGNIIYNSYTPKQTQSSTSTTNSNNDPKPWGNTTNNTNSESNTTNKKDNLTTIPVTTKPIDIIG